MLLLLWASLLISFPLHSEMRLSTVEPVERIAFASCNDQEKEQDVWKHVEMLNPQVWIWGGDNIYGNTEDMRVLKAKYQKQKNNPAYKSFISQRYVLGTWDDNDYGVNDGDKSFSEKEGSRDLALDFFGVPKLHPVWEREGLYQSWKLGPEDKEVMVILLDTRFFRDPFSKSILPGRRYKPSPEGSMLGDAQWTWLENEISSSTAKIIIIVSSIQILSDQHGWEKWGNFPHERLRFKNLLLEHADKKVLLLSGDRHFGEISRWDHPKLRGPIFEMTSSGLTHVWRNAKEKNRHRVGEMIRQKHYGMIEIGWRENADPSLRFQFRSIQGEIIQETLVFP